MAEPHFSAVSQTIMGRCAMCHAAEPVWAGIVTAPKGVRLDDAAQIKLHASLIDINAARSKAMPPGNVTEMTPEERQVLASWIAAGAPDK
jgi:uncharacterized membrane protein